MSVVAEPNMSGASSRQSQMVADEMFPDGPGPLDFVDVEDGVRRIWICVGFMFDGYGPLAKRFSPIRFVKVLRVVLMAAFFSLKGFLF